MFKAGVHHGKSSPTLFPYWLHPCAHSQVGARALSQTDATLCVGVAAPLRAARVRQVKDGSGVALSRRPASAGAGVACRRSGKDEKKASRAWG